MCLRWIHFRLDLFILMTLCSTTGATDKIHPRHATTVYCQFVVSSFQASATMLKKTALFWDITRRLVVTVYRSFRTTYGSHLHGSRVRVGKKESQQYVGCHHAYWLLPWAHFPYRIYVIRCWFLSFILGLLTCEDGTDTLSRNVGKQLPHDAA